MKLVKTILASMMLLSGVPAWAQSDVAVTLKSEPTPALKRNSIELRPIESLASATPGVAAGGATFETYLGNNFAGTIGGSYADMDLPQKYVGTVNEESNAPMVDTGYGYSTGAGLRYYDHAIGDSLYGGVGVDYSEAHYGFKYNDETYDTDQFAVTPSVTAGYRWVWQNGALARLGAGVGLPSVASSKVVSETSGPDQEEGLDKVTDILGTNAIAKLDLGIGMMF